MQTLVRQALLEPIAKGLRGFDLGQMIADQQETATYLMIPALAGGAFREMELHPHHIDSRKGVVDKGYVMFAEVAAVHSRAAGVSLRLLVNRPVRESSMTRRGQSTSERVVRLTRPLAHSFARTLPQGGPDNRSKRVPGPVQSRLYRPEIAVRNLSNLLVRLPFQLAEDEHLAMMLGQFAYR